MKTKVITLLINSLSGGGAEGVCVNLANSLVDRGWKVTLVVLHLNQSVHQKSLNENVKLVVLGKNHARTALVALSRFLRQHKPARILVFNHQLAVLLVLLRTLLRLDVKIIARNINTLSQKKSVENSIWHKHIVHALIKTFYRKVDRIVAQSGGMADDLIDAYGVSAHKIVIINNPISASIQNYQSARHKPVKVDYLLCVGRLEPQKAFHYAITSFAAIAQDYPGLRLKIVGSGSLENELKEHARAKCVADRVDFEGYQSDIIPYYVNARATVLTSLYEGFPNVLLESVALGTPVAAFDCPSGVSEIVQDGVNGFLVPYKDKASLVEALQKVLNTDWSSESVSKTADPFRSDRIVPEYEKVIA